MKRWIWVVMAMLAVLVGSMGVGRPAGAEPVVMATPGPVKPVALGNVCLSTKQAGWSSWSVSYMPRAVYALQLDGNQLWVGSGAGVRRLDVRSRKYETFLPGVTARNFLRLDDGRIWAVTSYGFQFFDGAGWRFVDGGANANAAALDSKGQFWTSMMMGRRSWWYYAPEAVPPAEGALVLQSGDGPVYGQFDCNAWPAVSLGWWRHETPVDCLSMRQADAALRGININPYLLEVGSKGVWWSNGNRLGFWANGKNREWKLSVDQLFVMEAATDGGLWLGTERGLGYFDPRTGKMRWIDVGLDRCTLTGAVSDVAVDGRGQVWAATSSGLYRWVARSNQWQRYPGLGDEGTMAIRDLAVDGNGTLWVAGYRSLWRINSRGTSAMLKPAWACSPVLLTLGIDGQGQIWGVSEGCGVLSYNPGSRQWAQYLQDKDAYYTTAAVAPDGVYVLTGQELWIYRGGNWESGGVLPGNPSVPVLESDPAGGIWIWDSLGGSLWRYQNGQFTALEEGAGASELAGAAVDDAGQLWVGVRAGVKRYAGGNWTVFKAAATEQESVTRVVHTRDGRIWVLRGNELLSFDPAKP